MCVSRDVEVILGESLLMGVSSLSVSPLLISSSHFWGSEGCGKEQI